MARQYKEVGLNEQGGKDLNYITENSEYLKLKGDGGFLTRADIYRIAVSIAISKDLSVPDDVGTIGSSEKRPNGRSWKISDIDKSEKSNQGSKENRSLENMVKTLCAHPSAKDETWGYIERLAHAGMADLRKQVKSQKLLSEILS